MTIDTAILALIPQRPPMVMADSFVYIDELHQYSLFRVTKENIFVDRGFLTEGGLVENIAQTAAARMGYLCRREGKPVPPGYIGAVQNLEIFALPQTDDEIKTDITVTNQVFNATLITGRILLGETLLAQCDMKIFISNQ
jgi:predicted hotdog family 3-hydroxylacyl-ACP dehydratase